MDAISAGFSIDIVTLVLTRGIMQMMLGGLLLYLGGRELNDQSARWWAFGFLFNGISLFVFPFDFEQPWQLVVNAVNHLSLGVGSVLFLIGFWQFGRQPIKPWLLIVLLAFPITSVIAWEVLWPNARYRVLCTAVGQVLYLFVLQHVLSKPFRVEFTRIYRLLRFVVIVYIVVFVWSYASIAELLPTTARQSLDYHKVIFSVASLLFMLTLAVACLALKFASLATRDADLAMRDWLTGLLNRRGFFHAIKPSKTKKHKHSLTSLLSIDIDHFKKINDAEGHAAGDQVLQHFAKMLKCFDNDNDNRLVARMGGEEFLVILFNTSEAEALVLAEDFRHQVEQKKVTLNGQKTIDFTISIGVYQVPMQENIEQALAHVDDALYAAKRKGRNQVSLPT